nr:unnamed protein product [Digitaria exilis]
MMADLAIGISKTAVEALVNKVNTAIKEEAELWQIVQHDTMFMKDEFEMMQSFLKTADWDLGEAAVTEIKLLKARVEEVSSRNMRYNLIDDSSSKLILPQKVASAPAVMGTSAAVDILTEAWSTEQKMGGSVNLSMLINESCDSLRVITLWGTRCDLGVTSIIKEAFEGEVVRQKFKSRAWVKLAHPFNPNQFIKRLAEQFYVNSCKDVGESITEVAKRSDLVKEFVQLNKGRYLVIIEDLSNMSDWQAVRTCLPDSIVVIDGLRAKEDWDSRKQLIPEPSQTSSIIVVVTAEESVAKYCTEQDDSVYRVKALAADDAIKLFEKNFQEGRIFRDDVQMKKEANYILTKCGGIPKVIIVVARYLGARQGDTRQRKLSHLKANFIHELETNPEFVSLRDLFTWMHLKFDALPWCLKRCILYEPVFSESKRMGIRPSHFVRRWIAEGYSKCTNSKTMEEYTAELFGRLSKGTASMGEWRVNSFFQEYINSRLMEERAVFFPLVVSIFDKSRGLRTTEGLGQHVVIGSSWNRSEEFVFEDVDFSHLQSLTVYGAWRSFFIPYKMKSLRVLDLEGTLNIGDDELQRMLELLPRLRFLSLRGHREITCLPDSLFGLRHLQTLDIRHTSVVYIELQKLKNLQYIRAGTALSWTDDREMAATEVSTPSRNSSGSVASWLSKLFRYGPAGPCNGIKVRGGLRHLQDLHTLGAVHIKTADGMGILDEISHLRQLKKLELSGINQKNSKFLSKSILNQKNLESLTLQLEKENHVVSWDDIYLPSSIRSLKLYEHVDKLSARRFNTVRNLRKLSLEVTRLLTRDEVHLLGCIHSLLTLCLRVKNGPDADLQFPAHLPVDNAQGPAGPPVSNGQAADGERQATAPSPARRQAPNNQDGNQQVPARLFGKLQVLEIASKSRLHVRNLRKLSLEMTKLLTEEDMRLLGSVQSLITLRLRVDNAQDGELQFPPQLPVNKDQSHGKNKAPDHLPVNKDQDGNQQVLGRLFSKLQVLELVCMSKLCVRLDEGAMEKLEVMKAHCCSDSSLEVTGLQHPVSLKQVCLQGSYGDALKEALQVQLASHPKKPALKLQMKTQSPSYQASRQ